MQSDLQKRSAGGAALHNPVNENTIEMDTMSGMTIATRNASANVAWNRQKALVRWSRRRHWRTCSQVGSLRRMEITNGLRDSSSVRAMKADP